MYRIELSAGEETAFRTIEELAVAIRRNVVTSKARIWHNASNKWLPIQFHPHYKLAVAMPLTQADLVAGPPVTPLSVLKLGEPVTPAVPSSREAATQAALTAWPAPKPTQAPTAKPAPAPTAKPIPARAPLAPEAPITLGTPAPEPRRAPPPRFAPEHPRVVQPARVEAPPRAEPARVVEPTRSSRTKTKGSRKTKKSGRSLHLALGGAVIAACAQLMISAASGRSSDFAERIRTPRRLIEAPIEAMQEDSPRTVAGVLPALQTIPIPRRAASPTRPVKKPAPKRDTLSARSDVMGATVDSDSTPEIQPAPLSDDLSASVHAVPVPVTSKVADSTGKKALKGLLNTIGGTPAPESKTPKR
ncbi:MAG TPA: hypothetical protein VIT87_05760 [Gemmatimonadales bacterium]